MNHLIVVAHPNSDSFNHAIVQTTVHALKAKGHETVVRDLYTLQFEPVLSLEDFNSLRAGQIPDDIKAEQGFITSADVITFIYPIWWTGLPGILKGYVDRVFSYGFAYAYGKDGNIEKLLTGKKGLLINTHGTPNEVYDSTGMTDAMKKTSDSGIFEFCGIEVVDHLLFGSVPRVDDTARRAMLGHVEEQVNRLF